MKLHAPERQKVVMTFDKPWEGKASIGITLIQEKDKIRLYYRGPSYTKESMTGNEGEVICYAESTDGIHFDKPELGLYEFEGSKANNIIWNQGLISHNMAPFRNDAPQVLPEERYKALGGKKGIIYGLVSADGIHWKLKQDEPILGGGTGYDSVNTMFWQY